MSATLNKSKPHDRIHGPDPLGRLFMQVQNGEAKYFDAQGDEVVEEAGEEEKPEKRRQGRPASSKNKPEPATSQPPTPEVAPVQEVPIDTDETGLEFAGDEHLDPENQLSLQGL